MRNGYEIRFTKYSGKFIGIKLLWPGKRFARKMPALSSPCLHVYFMRWIGEKKKSIVKHGFWTMCGTVRGAVCARHVRLPVCWTRICGTKQSHMQRRYCDWAFWNSFVKVRKGIQTSVSHHELFTQLHKKMNKLHLLRDQPSAGSEMTSLTYDKRYDNVLLDQCYRTPPGAVIDECGAMVE
jgi:hypothetical protein